MMLKASKLIHTPDAMISSNLKPRRIASSAASGMQALREHSEEHAATLSALWLCAQHLDEILLDRKVLPFGTFRQLPGCQKIGDVDIRKEMPLFMSLDGSAFDNLEVCLKWRPASPKRLPHAYALTSIDYGESLHVCD